MNNGERKLTYEEFFKKAILRLRDINKSRGIHSVYSGFNQAFREYFGEDPIKVTQELSNKGIIEIRPVKGGVMIYLPGEAPKLRKDLGKKALEKIFKKPSEHDQEFIDEAIKEVSRYIKTFPKDFLERNLEQEELIEIELPGTTLQIDSNSQTTLISPKRYFRYEAKNPPEAKFIIYAYNIVLKKIAIPKDSMIIFKAVKSYEKYCEDIKNQCFNLFLKRCNDEDMADLLTKEIEKRLDLRARRNQG